jgi:hypothetical protein
VGNGEPLKIGQDRCGNDRHYGSGGGVAVKEVGLRSANVPGVGLGDRAISFRLLRGDL